MFLLLLLVEKVIKIQIIFDIIYKTERHNKAYKIILVVEVNINKIVVNITAIPIRRPKPQSAAITYLNASTREKRIAVC